MRCLLKEWREENGEEGEDLYKNQLPRLVCRKKIIPTVLRSRHFGKGKENDMDTLTYRSLFDARPPFIKIFAKEEKLGGMSKDGMATIQNVGIHFLTM